MKKLSLNLQGGWAKDFGSSYPQRITTGYSTGYNVHFSRPNYLGDLSATPNVDLITLDDTQYNGKVFAGTTDSNGVAWVITSLGTTYKRSVAGVWSYFDDIGAVTQGYVGTWTHIDNNNNEIIIQSYWQNGGGFIVDKIDVATNTRSNLFTDGPNTFTTAQRVGIVGMNNVSYFTNGQYIGTWEPDINVYDQTRLNLGKGWTTTSICNYGNYIAIVGHKATQSRLWLWDGDSQDWNYSYDIGDYKATAVVNNGGQLIVFTQGKNGTTKIKVFTGNDFNTEPIWERPTTMIGNAPHHNSVDFYSNQIFFTNETGAVYSFGSPSDNTILAGLNNVLQLNVPTNKGGGICKNLQEDILFIGGDYDDTGKTTLFSTELDNSQSLPVSTGSLYTRFYELPYNSTIEMIKVYFSDFGDNYSLFSCELYKGNSTTNLLSTNEIQGVLNTDIKTYYPIACNIPEVDSFYLKLNLSNCSIRNIEIIYSDDQSGK